MGSSFHFRGSHELGAVVPLRLDAITTKITYVRVVIPTKSGRVTEDLGAFFCSDFFIEL